MCRPPIGVHADEEMARVLGTTPFHMALDFLRCPESRMET